MDTPQSVPEPETTEQKGLVVPNAYDTARAMVQHVDAQALLAMAIEKQVPIETMERLLALRERLKAEQAKELFFAALSDFQAECPIITKNKIATIKTDRGEYKYAYATLDEIVKQSAPLLTKNGLSVTFNTRLINENEPHEIEVACTVHHLAGHAETSTFRAPIDKTARMNDTQKTASATTYSKRYAYANALGILTCDTDDDANASGIKEAVAEVFRSPKRTATPESNDPGKTGYKTRSERRVVPPAQGPPLISDQEMQDAEDERVMALRRPGGSSRLMDAVQHRGLEKKIIDLAAAQDKSPALLRQELHTWAEKTLKKASFKLFTVEDLMRISSHINKLWNDVPPR